MGEGTRRTGVARGEDARRSTYLSIAIAAAGTLAWPWLPGSDALSRFLEDTALRSFPAAPIPEGEQASVFLDIDDESVRVLGSDLGRWPWPRRVYKDVLEFVALGEPRAILFDILFTEEQKGGPDDAWLAEASAGVGRVSHALNFLRSPSGEPLVIPESLREKAQWPVKPDARVSRLPSPTGNLMLPAGPLAASAPWLHGVVVDPDADGVMRRIPLFYAFGESGFVPSLAGQALRKAAGEGRWSLSPARGLETGYRLSFEGAGPAGRRIEVPLDESFRLALRYSSEFPAKQISFAAVVGSARQLMSGEVEDPAQLPVNPEEFRDKIVILGGSAVGLEDLKVTPHAGLYPGPLLHSQAMENALRGEARRALRGASWIGLGVVLLVGFVLAGGGGPAISASLGASLAGVAAPLAALVAVSAALFALGGMTLNPAPGLFFGGLLGLQGVVARALKEGRERRQLRQTFSKFMSPAVVSQLIESGQDPRAEVGTEKELTILFSDFRGFTSLSEKLAARELVELLNSRLSPLSRVIFKHNGTLDKFIGDAIMAFWGAPLDNPNHARDGVRCALEMLETLERLDRESRPEWRGLIKMGVGVNTGIAIVGNIGGDERLDYTVIGDSVNLASRLEGITKEVGASLVVGERTWLHLNGAFVGRLVDRVKVKGKEQAVSLYEVFCERGHGIEDKFRGRAEASARAIEAYFAADFSSALSALDEVDAAAAGLAADPWSTMLRKRCRAYLSSPPPAGWDGVFVAKSK